MGILGGSSGDMEMKCTSKEKAIMCRVKRGKSEASFILEATPTGMKIKDQEGNADLAEEGIRRVSEQSKIKSKNDLPF